MDFPTAPAVIDALRKTVEHGIFGYSQSLDDYYEASANWFSEHFGWHPEKTGL